MAMRLLPASNLSSKKNKDKLENEKLFMAAFTCHKSPYFLVYAEVIEYMGVRRVVRSEVL